MRLYSFKMSDSSINCRGQEIGEKDNRKMFSKNSEFVLSEDKFENIEKKKIKFLSKKKRLSKKIVFRHPQDKKCTNLIYQIIQDTADKIKLIVIPNVHMEKLNIKCNSCKKTKNFFIKKFVKFSNSNQFLDFFDKFYKNLDEKMDESSLSWLKNNHSQILTNKQDISKIQDLNINRQNVLIKTEKIYCIKCINNILNKNGGIMYMWEELQREEENIILDNNENLENNTTNKNKIHNKPSSPKNNDKNYHNKIEGNIFDLILENEEEENISVNSNNISKISNANTTKKDIVISKEATKKNKKLKFSPLNDKKNNISPINSEIKNSNSPNISDINKEQKIPDNVSHSQEQAPKISNISLNYDNNQKEPNNLNRINQDIMQKNLDIKINQLKNLLYQNFIQKLNETNIFNNYQLNIGEALNMFNNFKSSILILMNHISNLVEILDKSLTINNSMLSLMYSVSDQNLSSEIIANLNNNKNIFTQILYSYYNIQRINSQAINNINSIFGK